MDTGRECCFDILDNLFKGDFVLLRHIVTWNHIDGICDDGKRTNALKVKKELEALADSINEIIEIKVYINELSSSTADIMLDSLFENEETLNAYKIHPEHQRVGDFISSVMKNRVAFDYYV